MNILPSPFSASASAAGFPGAASRQRALLSVSGSIWIRLRENKAPSTGPVPDQSTPLNAAKLLLRALQEKTDWKNEPYKSLPATSPL